MKNASKKKSLLLIMAIILAMLIAGALGLTQTKRNRIVYADEVSPLSETPSAEFNVTDTVGMVEAVYTYARLNDTDCSVRIANKTEATKAVIPSQAKIAA